MAQSWTVLWSKAGSRFRKQGPRAAIRHYVGRGKQVAWQVIYDRRLDRLEHRPSGAAYTVRESEILGVAPPPGERLYQAFPRLPFLWSINALGVDPAKFSFIDYGSGRGRLILAAAELPFRRVIGVEFARSLHDDACENIACYPRHRLACRDVASLNLNAVDFGLPDGNVIAFFFNPFTGDVLDRVAQRIEDACRASPCSVYIIFANTNRLPLFAGRPAYRQLTPALMHRIRLAATAPAPIEFFFISNDSLASVGHALKSKEW